MPSQMEILEEVMEGPYDREYYQQVFSKGYFNDPRDENGEVALLMDYVLFKDGQEFEVFDNMENAIEEATRCLDDDLAEVYSYLFDKEVEKVY